MKQRILIVDDDESLRRVMEYALRSEGYSVAVASDGDEALVSVRRTKPDVIIADLVMKRVGGLALLKEVRQEFPEIIVIIVTAFASIESAVDAMRQGAHDYLVKPFARRELQKVVQRALLSNSLLPNQQLQHQDKPDSAAEIVATSVAMQQLINNLDRAAGSDFPVLLCGDSGTGKDLLARRLHRLSPRCDGPFVALNCAAIPHGLIESELFGHQKGSFTGAATDRKGKFEQANGGTLFLDEIGELPLAQQPKILRALQLGEIEPVGGTTRSVDVRVVAATNLDMEQAIKDGRFRDDLYYRLAVIPLHVPSLRERVEDIPVLAALFLQRALPSRKLELCPHAVAELKSYSWPGNVRELENLMMRLAVLVTDDTIKCSDLPDKIRKQKSSLDSTFTLPASGLCLRELERSVIDQALKMTEGNYARAARLLKVPRHVLLYRVEKYDLKVTYN